MKTSFSLNCAFSINPLFVSNSRRSCNFEGMKKEEIEVNNGKTEKEKRKPFPSLWRWELFAVLEVRVIPNPLHSWNQWPVFHPWCLLPWKLRQPSRSLQLGLEANCRHQLCPIDQHLLIESPSGIFLAPMFRFLEGKISRKFSGNWWELKFFFSFD